MNGTRGVLCFGEALVDMFQATTADGAQAFVPHAGGAPANVAVGVARLGGDARFVGMLGEDMFGDFLLESLRGAGVDTQAVARTREAKTALAFVAHDAQGERSFSFYRPPAADLLFRAEDFPPGLFEGAGVLHACSNSLTGPAIAEATLEAMRRARAAGALVSFDLNLRPMLWPHGVDPAPWLWQALALADLVKLSREELETLAEPFDGDAGAVVARLWQGAATLLVVTDGGGPVRWQGRAVAGTVPAFDVQVLDTTAAGDAFVAGMLYLLAMGPRGPETIARLMCDDAAITDVLRFAAAVGALAVTRRGAFSAMPTLDEAQALMREQP